MSSRRAFGALTVVLALAVGSLAVHLVPAGPLVPLVVLSPERQARIERKARTPAGEAAFSEPDRAEEYYVNSRTGPIITRGPNITSGTRTLDPARYLPALAQMRAMPRYDSSTNTRLPPRDSRDPAVDNLLGTWTALGPVNQGGRTRAFLIDPVNNSVMYAGGVAGGVWKSTDAGGNWAPVSDLMANIAVVALAFDPLNSNIIYAGTGEGFRNADAIRGAGIFQSTDAGLTWTRIPSTNTADFHYTMRIVVSPRNNQRIFAATRNGLFRSTNGGTSWTNLVASPSGGCTDMAIQVAGPTGFAFVSCGTTTSQGTVYRVPDDNTSSVESILSLTGQGRSSIAVAPSNESIVYVMASQRTASGGPGQFGLHGIYRSASSGAPGSFTTQRQGTVAPVDTAQKINQLLLSNPVYGLLTECTFGTSAYLNQGWYDNVIAVDPLDANRVWAGGVDLWRSDNAGVDWGTAGYWWFGKGTDVEYVHADHHGIVFHPQYNGTTNLVLFSLSDGGIARTDNARAPVNTTLAQICGAPVAGSTAWVDRNNGYVTTQFYDGVAYPLGESFFGGLQDNGTLRGLDGNQSWNVLAGGDGGYVAVDTLGDGNTANDVLFLENTGNSLQKSTNGGATFAAANTGITGSGFAFIAPFAMNLGNKAQLWTGGFDIWRTTNQAVAWARATGANGTCGTGSISAIATHPLDGNRVLVGMSDGCYHYHHAALSAPNTGTWPGGGTIATGVISWMAWDPSNINIAYATVSNFTATTVLKTVDGGVTWNPSMGSGGTALPQIPALTVAVDPANSLHVFVGTDLGVFVSIDGGTSWLLENTGFAAAPVEALKFNEGTPRRLFAFTHGRGAWSVSASCPAITMTPGSLPGGTFGAAYSQGLTASGGTGPYTFAVASGTVPAGLTLGSTGTLSGTATAGGAFNFTVSATDTNGCTGTQAYAVTIAAAPSTTTVTFEAGPYTYRGTPFTASATVTGPGGLSQSVPVTYGGNCTNVTGANGCTASASFAGSVNHLPSVGTAAITLVRATPSTTAGNASASTSAGSVVLNASVTSPTATVNEGSVTFTVRQGATTIGVPTSPGAVASGAASASFTIPGGTPAGSYTIDAIYNPGPNFLAGGAVAGTLTLSATCPAITVSPGSLPGSTVFASYNQALSASGGAAPYTLAVSAGTLPPGLTLTGGGGLSGTPSTAGAFNFSVTATDVNGCTGTQAYGIAVGLATSTTTVAFESGPYVYRGTPFTASATVTGPGGLNQAVPVTYGGNCANVTGANGCTASAAFAGSATHQASNGTSSITIVAATANVAAIGGSAPATAASVPLVASVTSTVAVNEGTVTFVVRQGAAQVGAPTQSGTVAGGAASASFSIPPGTPAGAYTVSATYNPGPNFVAGAATPATLTLTGGTCATITMSPGTLPAGSLFSLYSQTITAAGTAGPYTFATTAGALPPGLALSAVGGLSGTPTTTGTFTFTVTATDTTNGCLGTQAYALTVNAATSTTTVAFEAGPHVYRGTPFTATATVTGPGGLNQALPVSYSGDCTIPTVANGCTATANFAGNGTHLPSADARSITILQPTDAQPATGVRVDAVAGNLVRFRWTAPRFGPAPESYVLEGGVNPGDVLATLPTGSASPVFDVVVPAGSWHARIRTMAGGTVSADSNEVAVHVAVPVAPSAPASLTGVANGSTLGLSWKNTFAGGPPAGLILDVSGSAVTSIPLGLSESFAFSGVPPGTYTLQLRAVNGGGSSAGSAPVTLTFPGACGGAPAMPASFLAYRVGMVVSVIWDPPATGEAPTSYLVTVTGSFVGTFPLTTRGISAPVGPGSYTISVASVNACGTSLATPAQTIVVP